MMNNLPVKREAVQTQRPDPRADAINKQMRVGGTATVTYQAGRFVCTVVDNKLVIGDTVTRLREYLEEAYAGHGMMIKQGSGFGSGRVFGGYGTMVEAAKQKLIQRAANGEYGNIKETTASEGKLLE